MKRRKFLKLFAAAMAAPAVPVEIFAGEGPYMGKVDNVRFIETNYKDNYWDQFINSHTYGNMVYLSDVENIPQEMFNLVVEDARRSVPPAYQHKIEVVVKEAMPELSVFGEKGTIQWKYVP